MMKIGKKSKDFFPREGMVDGRGTWLAGQRPAPAEPGAGTMRLSEHRVGGRSLSVLRPDDQLRCNALAGCLLWQSYTVPATGGWCGSCTGPRASGLRSRRAVVCCLVPPCALLALGGTVWAEGWLDHTLWWVMSLCWLVLRGARLAAAYSLGGVNA